MRGQRSEIGVDDRKIRDRKMKQILSVDGSVFVLLVLLCGRHFRDRRNAERGRRDKRFWVGPGPILDGS